MQEKLLPYILVADDEEDTRLGLSALIQRESGQDLLLQAKNGLEAWHLLSTVPTIRLVFLDIHMPGMTGLQICQQIREAGMTTKIIIISGFQEFEYARQALRFQVTDYLLKPINPTTVRRLVREVIDEMHAEPELEPANDEAQVRLLIEQVRTFVHDHLEQEITLMKVAEQLHYSPNYLGALFKKHLGIGFQDYLLECRMQRAGHLLKDPSLRMFEIAKRVGYTNAKAFSLAFRKEFGLSPKDYREKHGVN